MLQNLVCPISNEKTDSTVSRLSIFLSVILVSAFMISQIPVFLYVAALDYFIKAFIGGTYSPLRFLAQQIAKAIGLPVKMIDIAPKIFASRLGFICLATAIVLFHCNMPLAALLISAMATTLFMLDALGVVCVGCIIYHHLVFPLFKNR